jgi:hypothetical protein
MTTLLKQIDEAAQLAREAFATGDLVTGIAAITLAAQLLQLARIQDRSFPAGRRDGHHER